MVTEEQIENKMPKTQPWESAKNAVKETMDLSIMKSVPARVRARLRELKEISSAKSEKIMYGREARWYTTQPNEFITKLDASIQNNIGVITYSVFKKNKDGNKELKENYAEVPKQDGEGTRKIVVSAEYVIKEDVVETFEHRKPVKIERFAPHE